MRPIVKKIILSLLLCVAVPAGQAMASATVLDVGVNRAELVQLGGPMTEVIVANPEVADVVVHASNKVSIIGKKIGSTNVRFFGKGGALLKEVDVIIGYDMPNIRRTLKTYYPDLRLTVDTINNSLAVSGIVPDSQTANRIMQIVYEFVKENRKDTAQGSSPSDVSQSDDRFPGVVNLMSLNSSQQVMLKVRIGELQRSALKKLGFNLQGSSGSLTNNLFQFGTGAGQDLFADGGTFGKFVSDSTLPSASSFGMFGGTITNGNFRIGGLLQMLEQDGLFKVLAEPSLTTVSGEPANFLAGGEFGYPVDAGDNRTVVEFKKYGVSLNFVPFVLSSNRIRLVVEPELSELDQSNTTNNIPSLTTRKAKTTVELAPGESFMIAGLIRDELNTAIQEVPGVAEIPIISALMRSTSYQRQETELVMSVTPYIVDPVVHSDIRLPTDEFRTPSSMELFFYGALGSLSGNANKISQKPVLEGPIGFMTD